MLANPRALVDVESNTVTGAMEEPLHASIVLTSLVAFPGKEISDSPMHLAAGRVVMNRFKGEFLGAFDNVVKLPHGFRSAPANDRARDVAEVPRFLRTR